MGSLPSYPLNGIVCVQKLQCRVCNMHNAHSTHPQWNGRDAATASTQYFLIKFSVPAATTYSNHCAFKWESKYYRKLRLAINNIVPTIITIYLPIFTSALRPLLKCNDFSSFFFTLDACFLLLHWNRNWAVNENDKVPFE